MPRLLLVEDAADVALLVERLGRRMGLEVAHRPDVPSAWDALRGGRPDLVLLDLNLPGERGEALCRRVRAAPDLADLAVALFSHWDRPQDVLSGLEAGADYVVSKELLTRPAAWQARLREILAPGDGLASDLSLSCLHNSLLPPPSPEGLEALNRALRHPLVRQIGPDVLRFLLRRAADALAPVWGDARHWLRPDGLALDARHVVPAAAVAALAVAVADGLQRLLGTEAVAPLRQALARSGGSPEAS